MNLFAAAYVRPNYTVPKTFNQKQKITAVTNLPDRATHLFIHLSKDDAIDAMKPLIEGKESNLFWVVYAASAFQFKDPPLAAEKGGAAGAVVGVPIQTNSNEPDDVSQGTVGFTDGHDRPKEKDRPQDTQHVSVIALETLRDVFDFEFRANKLVLDRLGISKDVFLARAEQYAVVHEVAHQFLGADHDVTSKVLYRHANRTVRRAGQRELIIQLDLLRFTNNETACIRERISSPGFDLPNCYGQVRSKAAGK